MEKQTIKRVDFSQVKPGDKLIRLIGNEIPMPVVVREIDAVGGYMGYNADISHLQIKMLNSRVLSFNISLIFIYQFSILKK